MTMNRSGRQAWAASVIGGVPSYGPVVPRRATGLSFRPRLRSSPPTSEASLCARGPAPAGRSAGRSCRHRLDLVEGRDDLGGVAFGLDFLPGPRDPPVRIDEERAPRDTHVLLAVIVL